ncbi:MAG: hypothetical protein M3P24_04880 [Gemmatimonadota bacterium]|nr:hypothetical protein [Gemmatimonadota bacterium]
MGIRQWVKRQLAVEEAGEDVPPGGSLLDAFLGRGPVPSHALGEYTAETYPQDVTELLRRRQQVMDELLRMNLTDRQTRQEAIPRLKELLRVYPHALAYEALIHAYLDGGRWDEAKGVAFAAHERRAECARSNLPELRAEIDFLHDWSPEEIDRLREEREGAR